MDEERSITDDLSDIETAELLKGLPNYFEYSGNIPAMAFLTWRFDSHRDVEIKFYEMGKAYFESALALIDICLHDNYDKKADMWIFPILFHAVHGIEVYLKGFISQYRIFAKLKKHEFQDSKIEGHHNIKQLCQVAVSLLKENDDKDLLGEFAIIQRFIFILYANTSDMAFARYPLTSEKVNQFYVDQTKNITIDLNVLKAWLCRVYQILDNCTGFVDFQIDEIKEWLYEMKHLYGEVYGGDY